MVAFLKRQEDKKVNKTGNPGRCAAFKERSNKEQPGPGPESMDKGSFEHSRDKDDERLGNPALGSATCLVSGKISALRNMHRSESTVFRFPGLALRVLLAGLRPVSQNDISRCMPLAGCPFHTTPTLRVRHSYHPRKAKTFKSSKRTWKKT